MIALDEIAPKELAAGLIGKYVHGSAITLGYVTIKAGSILPAHHHIHEQITFVIEGELELTVENDTFTLTEGTAHVIASAKVHSAIARKDCIVVDVFSPVRDDYR
jgi:quercetin dioxygenase-like cupin family protein